MTGTALAIRKLRYLRIPPLVFGMTHRALGFPMRAGRLELLIVRRTSRAIERVT